MPKLPESRLFRSALVVATWALVPLSVLVGKQTCTIAATLHRPCPGCGLTRATLLLMHGQLRESLAMHPLAVPILLCWGLFAFVTIRATWREGVPWFFYRERFGKAVIVATSVAYVALIVLWALREHGMFGGRGPVS